ncbi:Hypothetical protein Eab7_2492 [Exiguobacterium antarcticum B7]|nr:Hypothetical protein Eab7_2492 [Exiguobacterium antarcticum B7]
MEIVRRLCYKQMSEALKRPGTEAFTNVNENCFFTKSTQIKFRRLVSHSETRYNVTVQWFCSPSEPSR